MRRPGSVGDGAEIGGADSVGGGEQHYLNGIWGLSLISMTPVFGPFVG